MTTSPARPAIPARPAVYMRGPEFDTEFRDHLIREVRDKLGWPEPAVYADAGPAGEPRSRLAALAEAITAGQHDGVFVAAPAQLGDDLGQIEAFDRLCRQHGVLLRSGWFKKVTNTRALFEVVRTTRDFTVTDDHLRLLRHAFVF